MNCAHRRAANGFLPTGSDSTAGSRAPTDWTNALPYPSLFTPGSCSGLLLDALYPAALHSAPLLVYTGCVDTTAPARLPIAVHNSRWDALTCCWITAYYLYLVTLVAAPAVPVQLRPAWIQRVYSVLIGRLTHTS